MEKGFTVTKYNVRLKLKDHLLGTVPSSKSIYTEHIANKQYDKLKKEGLTEEEIQAKIEETLAGVRDLDEADSGKTTFHKDEEGFYLLSYQVKGFFKEAAKVLKEYGKLKQLRSKTVTSFFVRPNKIYIAKPEDVLTVVERPLKAQTPMGERVAIARSDSIPAGSELAFEIHVLKDTLPEDLIEQLLFYGEYMGLGQWRGSGAGSFEVVEFQKTGKPKRKYCYE